MATITPTITDQLEAYSVLATWVLGAGDDGAPVRFAGAADRTVQIIGTFGGASVAMQGSLDGTNWATLTDPQGNAINASSAILEAVTELVRFIRPVVTGGSGTNVTVMLFMRPTR